MMANRNTIGVVYRLQHMIRSGRIDALDHRLSTIDVGQTDTDLLLAWLTATLPVRYQLPARPELFAETKRVMIERGDFEPGILDGLE